MSANTFPTSVLFREIHKNAWLRKLPAIDKKCGALNKKGDRVWTVFCVHDDTEPFLEFYADTKIAATHKPEWFTSLGSTAHISPTICASDDEFEFVITLAEDIVRLTAPSWEVMMDWVDSLSAKLREMRVLSPRENVYSRMPEQRLPLLPTRDPNSPLPLPPAGPSALVPGIEPAINNLTLDSAQPLVNGEATNAADEEPATAVSTPSSSTVYITPSPTPARSTRPVLCRTLSAPTEENVTVIQVTAAEPSTAPINLEPFDFTSEVYSPEDEEEFFTPPATPLLSRSVQRQHPTHSSVLNRPTRTTDLPLLTDPRQWLEGQPVRRTASTRRVESGSVPTNSPDLDSGIEPEANSLYEHVFLPTSQPSSDTATSPAPTPTNTPIPTSAPTPMIAPTPTIVPSPAIPPTQPVNAAIQPQSAPTGRGRGAHRARRRSAENTPPVVADRIRALQPPPHPFRQTVAAPTSDAVSPRLTLREQQVQQLRREIAHPGGVRLQLRRKDSLGSIALVDAFNAVWVAGWKQKEHPMLYNALHIGDQLFSVAGIPVQNATDAQRLIRGAPSLYIEFVIRRVPLGRVYALRRATEGQDLGVVLEGNTAEVREMVAGSIAAACGLSSRTPTVDGLSLCTWAITEVNGRPLNLFFKDGEVKDRLNAVGLDISLLVQPFDLVKQLKKQLKALRSYKEYIVQ